MPNICPDCTSGEHHPGLEITTLHWQHPASAGDISDKPLTGPCECKCTEPSHGPHKYGIGERVRITAGRWVDQTMRVDDIINGMAIGAVIDPATSTLKVVHVPTNQCEVIR